MSVQTEVLASWHAGVARGTIVEFVQRTVSEAVPVEERVAVFDNDGTLWCEKPMPIQADFILRRLSAMAQADPELRGREPWKAAYERDYAWVGKFLAEHYAGNDKDLPTLAAGVLAAFEGVSVEDFEAESDAFLRGTASDTWSRVSRVRVCTDGRIARLPGVERVPSQPLSAASRAPPGRPLHIVAP